jgi:hypothetical protein
MASWWRTRAVVLGAALLVLVAIVALATRAEAPAGGGGARQVNGQVVVEYGVLAAFLLAAAALPILVWSLWGARDDEPALPNRGNWMRRLLVTIAALSLIGVGILIYRSHHQGHKAKPTTAATAKAVDRKGAAGPRARPAGFDWVPLVAVLAVGFGGAGLAVLLLARGRPSGAGARPANTAAILSDALDESLDDLRAEQDARRAVIGAYARMERACAAAGVPRRASEAPLEYLARVLTELLHASAASVSRLTALFERAQFSLHAIGPELKAEAIEALVAVRDELRALPA